LLMNQISAPLVNLNSSDPIQCCDYYSPRVGYQFT
jgi:hypothetical protein